MIKPALSMVIHGVSGTGKSRFGVTTPTPRLVIDAEYGSRFAAGRKRTWNYYTDRPPIDDGTWDTVLITPREWRDTDRILEWLESGDHPFNSVTLDTATEIQKRLINKVAGVEQVTQPQWGEIWRKGDDFIRRLRDLIMPESMRPLDAVVILALTQEQGGMLKPALSGKLAQYISAAVDLTGYMYVEDDIPHQTQHYKMLITKTQQIEAKDRTGALRDAYGPVVENPNVQDFLAIIAPMFNEDQVQEGTNA